LRAALRDFRHVASLFPSSRFSIRSVLTHIPPDAQAVVEYGPGTGNFTRGLLRHLGASSQLICVELNPEFVPGLRQIEDPRLQVVEGSVLAVLPSIRACLPKGVDAVISGIPFSLIPADEREKIIEETRNALRPGGCFIAYQNSRLLVPLFERYFDSVSTQFEARNVFPYFIMVGRVAK
jgi:phospholipid N-methyltransferase